MVIADAIVHAIDPPLLFFLYQQVERAGGNPGGNLGVIWRILWFKIRSTRLLKRSTRLIERLHEALDEKEHQDHQRRYIFGGDGGAGLISSFVLKCNISGELTSRIFFPENNPVSTHADQMRC